MSASGGIQKGSGSTGRGVADAAARFEKQYGPVVSNFLNDVNAAQQGGIPASQIGNVQRSTEASFQAMGDTLRGLDETQVRQGIAGTGGGSRARSLVELAGRQATSQVPLNVINALLGGGAQIGLSQPQTILQALGQVGRNKNFGFQQSGGFLTS